MSSMHADNTNEVEGMMYKVTESYEKRTGNWGEDPYFYTWERVFKLKREAEAYVRRIKEDGCSAYNITIERL